MAAREILPDDDEADADAPRGGCGMLGLALALIAVFAVLIVGLAAAAGWTSGQRQAGVNGTATRSAAIQDQLARIPEDVSGGNLALLDARIRFLATLTPGIPGMADVAATATSLYLTLQPTATPTPTASATPSATPTPTATLDPALPTPTPGPAFDLAQLLNQAQAAYAGGQYEDAAEFAEAISQVDPAYEPATVRQILGDSLGQLARNYYNAMQPAAGNRIVGRMEALGIPVGELAYERTVGEVYLNALSNIGISFPRAIAALQELRGYGQGRYFQEASTLLYQQYVAYGDALAFDPAYGYCPAVAQYQNALAVFNGGDAAAKFSNAQTLCSSATPTFDPLMAGTPGMQPPGTYVPLGQPGG